MRWVAAALALGLGLGLGCKSDPPAAEPTSGSTSAATDAGSSSGTASDTGSDTQGSSSSTGSGEPRLAFEEIEVEGGLEMATDLALGPGGDDLYILDKSGRIGRYTLDGVRLGRVDVPGVHSDLDCGLISLAFDADGALYVSACLSQEDGAILRVDFDDGATTEILRAGDPDASRPWHNVGRIGFDESGALWALFGDKRVPANGQDVDNDLSALVRIIPTKDGSMPAAGNHQGNVYAYGLRSPWRGVLDNMGRWWVGDVGANGFEEINLITAAGENFGWNLAEGPCEEDCAGLVEPITLWEHDTIVPYMVDDEDVRSTVSRTVYVGLQYQPNDEDPYDGWLDNAVLFGDYCLGFLRAAEANADGELTRDEHLGHLDTPTGWVQGPDGHIYVTTFGICETAGLEEDDPPASRLLRAVRR